MDIEKKFEAILASRQRRGIRAEIRTKKSAWRKTPAMVEVQRLAMVIGVVLVAA